MIEIVEYADAAGNSPFRLWFDGLDREAAAIVTVSVNRLGTGNTSNAKAVGGGVTELKINRGPGYRVYFGWDGATLVILLGGGTKKRQEDDIEAARHRWQEYKRRKRAGRE